MLTETKTVENLKISNSFEDFMSLIDEAKLSCKEIHFNGKKMDKRRSLIGDFEDIFDNNVKVKYLFHNRILFVGVGDYY